MSKRLDPVSNPDPDADLDEDPGSHKVSHPFGSTTLPLGNISNEFRRRRKTREWGWTEFLRLSKCHCLSCII
jgi:hypothetical protein